MISHLLHIGYPKTGSKFLQRWFSAHPRIAFAQWGIAGAANATSLAETLAFDERPDCVVTSFEGFTAPLSDYSNIDHGIVERLVPRRAALVRLAEALSALFPGARVLIVTRGYREMMRSYHGEAVRNGVLEPLDTFCRRFFLAPEPDAAPLDYDFTIGLYERLFGADRLLVLPYELLSRDPDRFVRTIEEWLGIAHVPLPLERIHESLSPAELRWYRGIGRFLASLPLGEGARKRLRRLHLKLVEANRLAWAVRLAGRVRPATGCIGETVPDAVTEAFRGSASRLKGRPFYEGLEAEYLL